MGKVNAIVQHADDHTVARKALVPGVTGLVAVQDVEPSFRPHFASLGLRFGVGQFVFAQGLQAGPVDRQVWSALWLWIVGLFAHLSADCHQRGHTGLFGDPEQVGGCGLAVDVLRATKDDRTHDHAR